MTTLWAIRRKYLAKSMSLSNGTTKARVSLAVVQAKGLFNLERATGNLGAFSASSAENPWPPEVWMLRSIRTSEGPRAWSRVTGAAVVAPRSLFVLVVCCSSGSARSLASMQSSPGATASR